jgi:hypothetical protein
MDLVCRPGQWPSGEQYTGEWMDDKRSGQGTNKYASGLVYTGEWKADKKHGQGVQVLSSGERLLGEWVDDDYNYTATSSAP